MRLFQVYRVLPLATLLYGLPACGDEASPEEGHTPQDARLFLDGVDVSQPGPLTLIAGQTARVELKLFAEDGDEITGIESDHFTSVNIQPAGLATSQAVSGANFQKDLTAGAEPGRGTYTIGYGHDEAADELSFGPYEIVVIAQATSH